MFRRPAKRSRTAGRPAGRPAAGAAKAAVSAGVALALAAGCAPSSGGDPAARGAAATVPPPSIDSSFSLPSLVAAAKREGSLSIYDSTGDIVEMAKAFGAKYGIKATGTKSKSDDTLEKMTRENQAGNVTIDVAMYEDGPSFVGQLLPQKVVYTWLPGDLADGIPAELRTPPMVLAKANVWIYNTRLFPRGCPIKNMWDLTSPTWRGKVVMQDPLGKPNIIGWFNQLAAGGAAPLAEAYKQANGGRAASGNAAREWVKALAKNAPILTSSDDDAAAAVAAPNQSQPRVALVSNAKFRDVKGKGYAMRVCEGLAPWVGYQYPKYVGIATKSERPNAAKLFVHYAFTKEGIDAEMHNGGISGNSKVGAASYSPPGLTDWKRQLFVFDPKNLPANYRDTQSMQDFWRLNHG